MEFLELLLSLYLSVMQADFMKMPFDDNTFDAVYAIEATCHAPDPVRFQRFQTATSLLRFIINFVSSYNGKLNCYFSSKGWLL
jgi:ubiquinone/menaquinone biosynthesis C-methylase UbiE